MKVAIIGAGFTGLAAAWKLSQHDHNVTIYESSGIPGGLAAGFINEDWQWSLEHHYHHIFESDQDIISFAREQKASKSIIFTTSKTSVIYNHQLHPFDSPLALFKFPHLNLIAKIRTAIGLTFLKATPSWKILESISAKSYIQTIMGNQSWQVVWQPLFEGKFGKSADIINAAWFWARIKVRSKKLGYFNGGFLRFAKHVTNNLIANNVSIKFSTKVSHIDNHHNKLTVKSTNILSQNQSQETFDKILITTTSPVLLKLLPNLPLAYKKSVNKLKSLAAQTLILELKKPFFQDKTYWLNVNQNNWPFLAVVEHTNFMPKKYYANNHLVYIGRYLDREDPDYKLSKKALLSSYQPYLEKLSPGFTHHLSNSWLYKADFAQPIVTNHHSRHLPSITTPLKNIYWASMQHIYPFDRGTNYAVKIGNQAAKLLMHDQNK